MLDNKGFDLWADGYDKAVGISEEANAYTFIKGLVPELSTCKFYYVIGTWTDTF